MINLLDAAMGPEIGGVSLFGIIAVLFVIAVILVLIAILVLIVVLITKHNKKKKEMNNIMDSDYYETKK